MHTHTDAHIYCTVHTYIYICRFTHTRIYIYIYTHTHAHMMHLLAISHGYGQSPSLIGQQSITGQDWGFAQNGLVNAIRRLISLQAQCFITLAHLRICMFQDDFLEKSLGKVNLLRASCVTHFRCFAFVASLECNCLKGVGDLNPFIYI